MNCSCNVGNNYEDDEQTGYIERRLRAAKAHKCRECGNIIQKGETFVFCTCLKVGDISNYKMCSTCHEIATEFFHDGWIFTQIMDSLGDYFYQGWRDDLPSNCISKLSPPARSRVCDMLQEFQESGA